MPLLVIDVNTSFGKRVDADPRYQPAALLEQMDRHGVALACAYSQRAVDYDPRGGNTETIELAAAEPRIVPVGVLDLRDMPGWERELHRCRDAGVHLMRLFPRAHGWNVESASCRRAFAALAGSDACLVVGGLRWPMIAPLARLAQESGVPLILADVGYSTMAEAIAAMDGRPNVYLETNNLASVGAVKTMAEAVGPHRLLYGSAAPAHPMQTALNQVVEADLAEEAKAAILGGNAMELLGLDMTSPGLPPGPGPEPLSFGEDIVDVHAHLGYWRYPIPDEDYDPDGMLRRMGRFGISTSIVSSYESMRYDVATGNRKVADAIAGHPEILGYVELDPYHLELSCAEMDRYYELPNFVGCELELTHIPCPTGSEEVAALMAEIARRGKPVLLKTARDNDALAERELALRHPELTIIHAHGASPNWARAVRNVPNICIEFCWSRPSHHSLRDCLDILGAQRVLFGSDQTLLSVGAAVGLYLDARMNARERRLVLRENARRIFGLSGGPEA